MMTGALTAQEQAILEGKTSWVETSEEFDQLLDEIRRSPIRCLVERNTILTEVYRSTEGEPINVRHAKFLKVFAEQIPVYIHPNEMIVGSPAPWTGRYFIAFAELDGSSYTRLKDWANENPRTSQPFIDTADWKTMK